jgi:hypothetical protein
LGRVVLEHPREREERVRLELRADLPLAAGLFPSSGTPRRCPAASDRPTRSFLQQLVERLFGRVDVEARERELAPLDEVPSPAAPKLLAVRAPDQDVGLARSAGTAR